MTRDEEQIIIEHIRSGKSQEFEKLVLEYQNRVYTLALRMTGSEEDARDMSQEAFLRAYNSLDGFRGDCRFSVWLYRLTSNICIDYIRRSKRRDAVSLTFEYDDGELKELEIPDRRFEPQTELERREMIRAVNDGLAQLSSDYRQILILREIEGLSYGEIGQALGLEEGTVKSRIFRARKKLCAAVLSKETYAGSDLLSNAEVASGNISNAKASNKPKGV